MSWTPNIDVAQMFSNRRLSLGEGPGVVLEIQTEPHMIISEFPAHTSWLGEDEYILDPRMIERATFRE
jgi:hypothetical protein